MTRVLPLLSLLALAPAMLSAQNDPTPSPKPSTAEAPKAAEPAAPEPTFEQRLAKYNPKSGKVAVGTVATVDLPAGWLWLGGADGRRFLTNLGNQPGASTLGVALPADFADASVFAVYNYSDEGHVDDGDTPDYSKLLEDMKANAAEDSKARQAAGLQGVSLLGWAEPPHYDKTQHKLYWAERLQFDGEKGQTLNYNVRVLGRGGHLVVNGVGNIDQLALVAEHSKTLLGASEFVDGQRYEQFDASLDKVAAYGLGGLVAGGIALKVGLFAKLGVLLKVLIKPILVGLAVVGGFIAKLFTGKKKSKEAEA